MLYNLTIINIEFIPKNFGNLSKHELNTIIVDLINKYANLGYEFTWGQDYVIAIKDNHKIDFIITCADKFKYYTHYSQFMGIRKYTEDVSNDFSQYTTPPTRPRKLDKRRLRNKLSETNNINK